MIFACPVLRSSIYAKDEFHIALNVFESLAHLSVTAENKFRLGGGGFAALSAVALPAAAAAAAAPAAAVVGPVLLLAPGPTPGPIIPGRGVDDNRRKKERMQKKRICVEALASSSPFFFSLFD